jgi:aminopeptidase N
MTDEIFALNQYIKLGAGVDHPQVQKFYKKWGHDSLVMIKWFSGLAANSKPEVVINTLKKLEVDPLFKNEVPNYLRALYVQFGRTNLVGFHQVDGSGYEFLGERLSKVDKFNPQTASRIATAFAIMNKLDSKRQGLMKNVLLKVQSAGVSKDLGEVISKYLA